MKMVICRRSSDLTVWSVLAIHWTVCALHRSSTSLSLVALERSRGGSVMDMPRPMGSGKLSANSKAKENTPEASQKMKRDSRVSEHLDTNFAIVTASLSGHRIEIPEKWRPPGRSNNLRTYGWIPFPVTSMRVPVNFGDIEGGQCRIRRPLHTGGNAVFSC